MTDLEQIPSPPHISLSEMQELTAATAAYETKDDAEGVLRSGLVEEIAEYVMDASPDAETRKNELEGEVGDVLWYISEISRFRQVDVAGLDPSQDLEDFQRNDKRQILPIVSEKGEVYTKEAPPQIGLAVTALRVVDVMNPKNDNLWLPNGQRLTLEEALGDLLTATSYVAANNDISLSLAIQHTLDKLISRSRNPHVNDLADQEKLMSSRRDRLAVHPFVNQLLIKAITTEEISKPR